ncbi:MAG: methionine--tRNA ligase [Myxococcales bacterium]|nr:methionine--tRNA ligase [Myxococcales bacterium]
MSRFYATTPIYYANGKPHIGHAYCTTVTDAATRFHRLLGDETYFCTGTDEHGQKVQESAEKRGITPQQHVDELQASFRDLWPTLNIEPDQFIRTTEPRHKAVVQRALGQLFEDGLIEKRSFSGWYSTSAERFWTEKDLVDGRCPDTGQEVVWLEEANYFFLMSRFQKPLIEAIETGKMRILPANRANEVLGFLREPLLDLCISRPKSRLSWGIELPFDTDFVTYVWFDALLNYVTAIGGYGAEEDNKAALGDKAAPAGDAGSSFAAWWPNVCHFLGKDILTTHAVYWPTMLMALGLEPPRQYVVTGWWLMADTKMSKSLGNVVDPLSLKDKYGPEVLRWFLLREMAVGQDANFSEAALVKRNNTDLANDLGNLVQRTTAIVHKHFDSQVPALPEGREPSELVESAMALGDYLCGGETTFEETKSAQQIWPVAKTVDELKLHVTLADIMTLVQRLNQVLAQDQPFKTVKTDKDAARVTIYHVLEGIRFAANLLWPALPKTADAILARIGWGEGVLPLSEMSWGELPGGAAVPQGSGLFPRYKLEGDKKPGNQGEKKGGGKAKKASKPKAPEVHIENPIDYEQFMALDLRVGDVLAAEPVKKSKKLLRLEVSLGEMGMRQILAGVAEHLTPEQLVGSKIQVLTNLQPRKLMGMWSQGMMMLAETPEGALVPMRPDGNAPAGSKIA